MPGKKSLAELPTPLRTARLRLAGGASFELDIKLDNLSARLYGGNKVRKLEYWLHRAGQRRCEYLATFGTTGSHQALATALYAHESGWRCICFLSHERPGPGVLDALKVHASIGTRLVHYGGGYAGRIATLRKHLWGKRVQVIPAGGTSWLGSAAFLRAGEELAAQVAEGRIPEPDRLYVACGTMGTAAGLALGLALSGLRTEVQAVRVSPTWLCNERALARILRNTVLMLRRIDDRVPSSLDRDARIVLRHEFFAGGYGRTNEETERAIALARHDLGLELEATYTGKALAALCADAHDDPAPRRLFWNTFNSAALPTTNDITAGDLPPAFRRYLPA